MRNRGLAFKLIMFFSATCVLLFLLIFGFFYRFTRSLVWKDIEENSRQLVLSTVFRIEAILRPVEKVPEGLALYLENATTDREEMLRILGTAVRDNPDVFGCAVAFEPNGFDKKSRYFAPYYYKENGRLRLKWLGSDVYRYFHLDWYQIPRELGLPIWTEPYMDEGGGGILMATYSVPFYRMVDGKKRFAGVVTADVSLAWLTRIVSSIKILKTGDGFLISKNGTFVTHPLQRLIMNETIFSVAEARGDPILRGIGKRMIRGETGFAPYRRVTTNAPSHMFFAPIASAGWSLAVVFPDAELMADMRELSWTIVLLGAGGLLLLLIVVVSECRSITRPLTAMAEATAAIAAGNLDVELPPARSQDEVGRLADAFRSMKDSLKEHIALLTKTTATKERILSELNIAREIQMSTLPKIFPPLPGLPQIELHALLEPARQVGGDLYDFHQTDADHFCFVIGDVSGKGVPAALFMAITKTLLKSAAGGGGAPQAVLARVNDALCESNDKNMFVTVFLGILNVKTGELRYANGGHNPPLILRRGGEWEFLSGGNGPVLGALPASRFGAQADMLRPGDQLFLYTDGVPEAMDPGGALFGEERMLASLRSARQKPPRELILGVLQEVAAFARGEHSDDITMMALLYRGDDAARERSARG